MTTDQPTPECPATLDSPGFRAWLHANWDFLIEWAADVAALAEQGLTYDAYEQRWVPADTKAARRAGAGRGRRTAAKRGDARDRPITEAVSRASGRV